MGILSLYLISLVVLIPKWSPPAEYYHPQQVFFPLIFTPLYETFHNSQYIYYIIYPPSIANNISLLRYHLVPFDKNPNSYYNIIRIRIFGGVNMTEQRAAIRRIMIAVNRIENIYEKISKELGVKANIIRLLYALDDGIPHSQKQICEEWLFPRTTLNTITKECVEQIPGKRREMNICLTEAGRSYARESLDKIYNAEETALEKASPNATMIDELENFCDELKIAFKV